MAESKGEVHRLWEDECKKKEKLEADEYRNVISSLLKLDDVEGAEKVYGEWEPDGPKLDLSIPGLLISRFCAERNELRVGELMSSIGKKRNGMHLRMVRAFIYSQGRGICCYWCIHLMCRARTIPSKIMAVDFIVLVHSLLNFPKEDYMLCFCRVIFQYSPLNYININFIRVAYWNLNNVTRFFLNPKFTRIRNISCITRY